MFERFTDRARGAVVLAQEEARMLDHDYIGTEHILLGLVRQDDGVAARVFAALGVELDAVRGQVEQIVGRGQAAPAGHIPFTPRAKKVLELALREALQLGHHHIGTEHVVLGLIREGEGAGAQVLVSLGTPLDSVRLAVMDQIGPAGPPRGQPRRSFGRRRSAVLDPFTESEESSEPFPLEQFDDGAWDALTAARRSARRRAAVVIDTSDLIVAVASVPGPGNGALRAAGLDPRALQPPGAQGESEPQPPSALSYSDAARDALHRAAEEAQHRDHAAVGTGHILLALLLRPDEQVDALLDASGVTRDDLNAEIAQRLV